MAISEADLDAKRRRAAELRTEISSIQADTASVHSLASDAIASAELDAEIARLERDRDDALHHQVGSVEHAKAMLEKAVATAGESDTTEPIEVDGAMSGVEPAPSEEVAALERAKAEQAAAEEVTQVNEEAKKATPSSVAKRTGGSK